MSSFTELLRFYRKQYGKSQAELAKAAQLKESFISKVESGKYIPSKETANQIAKALGLTDAETRDLLESLDK